MNFCSHGREVVNREGVGYAVHAPLATLWGREAKKLVIVIIFRNDLYECVRITRLL